MEDITRLKAEVYDLLVAKETRMNELKQIESAISERNGQIEQLYRAQAEEVKPEPEIVDVPVKSSKKK